LIHFYKREKNSMSSLLKMHLLSKFSKSSIKMRLDLKTMKQSLQLGTIRTQIRSMSNNIKRTLPPLKTSDELGRPVMKVKGIPILRSKKELSWGEWMISEEGRKFVCIANAGIATVVFAVCASIETSLPRRTQLKYAEQIEGVEYEIIKRDDLPEHHLYQPNKELARLGASHDISTRAKLDNVQTENTSVFVSELMDPVVIGTTYCRDGSMVGIPRHMMWTSKEEVDLTSVKFKPFFNPFFKGYKIPSDASPELMEELKEALVLTKEEREFAVSYFMAKGNQIIPWFHSFVPGVFVVMNYLMIRKINNGQKLFEKSRIIRVGISALITGINMLLLLISHNNFKDINNVEATETVIRTSEDVEHAVSFYNKLIKRNKIVRKILGSDDGGYYIDEEGEIYPAFYESPQVVSYAARLKQLEFLKTRISQIEAAREEYKNSKKEVST